MDSQEMERSLMESRIRQIANDLSDLYLAITTITCGLEAEAIEPQVIANLNSIARCVGFIQKYAHCALELKTEDETENRHE